MAAEKEMTTLLGAGDPPPVQLVNDDSDVPILLLCEHAGQAIPSKLGDLGISRGVIDTHRGWDIGAEKLALLVSEILSAPLVMQRYSRLVIDCNRPPLGEESIPLVSDGIEIPLNRNCLGADRQTRIDEIFLPLDHAIEALLDRHSRSLLISIHSFTPQFGGKSRPWHAGFLSRTDHATAGQLKRYIADKRPNLHLALNQPYQIHDSTDWFIPKHAEKRKLAHTLVEIRNDQLHTQSQIDDWAELISGAIKSVLEQII
ncbi:MAG: N-formylglutamate amidohydrolase [Rhizobiaceae bacterium]